MKRLLMLLLVALVMACTTPVWADAVYIIKNGHQSDETYDGPRVYSAPDSIKLDNHEALKDSYQLLYPGYRGYSYDIFPIIWITMEIMTGYGPITIVIPIDCRYTIGF